MTTNGVLQLVLYVGVLLALVKPVGAYIARVYTGRVPVLERVLGPVERLVYRACGVHPDREMAWPAYAGAMLLFNLVGLLAVYAMQRCQGWLPLNPQHFPGVSPDSSFNTAVSFATNTNWQGYGGETTMSYATQMLALTVQNFVSAAAGMAVMVALIRGIARKSSQTIGNFWVDLTRTTLYILLPLSLLLAVALVSQGVVQTLQPYQSVRLVQSTTDAQGKAVAEQLIAVGPAASQIAIKQLGTNGGGFFNVNSAHPLENPTALSNGFELLAILLIPAAVCYTFGKMVGDTRQGWALLAVMTGIFVGFLAVCAWSEGANPQGGSGIPGAVIAGANMEGKEVRHGIANSALWATATTAASNGSVNAMHDSFTPLGGLVPMLLMQIGEVIYGGVGSGLYGMLLFAVVTVFIAGLMVGRTPEYLGKKIEAYEMKMASLGILIPCAAVLVGTAFAVVWLPMDGNGTANPGPHGFSEILYAYSSASNNNGSAFAGLSANTPFYNLTLGIAMLAGRYGVMIVALAIAGSLAAKKLVPPGAGTLPTHTPLFIATLISVILVVAALTFIPALALGPIAEQLAQVQP